LVDGITMGFDDITLLSRQLAEMSHRQRADSPCIGPQRADLVLAGCAILEAICSLWPMGRLTVADRGLREGMLMDLMAPSPALLGAKALQGGKTEPLLVSVPPRAGTFKAHS
jgi:exopolyphosphatase/guanosine-5'-triphosphate,3'-diphosphate pyrophosphatase